MERNGMEWNGMKRHGMDTPSRVVIMTAGRPRRARAAACAKLQGGGLAVQQSIYTRSTARDRALHVRGFTSTASMLHRRQRRVSVDLTGS